MATPTSLPRPRLTPSRRRSAARLSREVVSFAAAHKIWWLVPIVVVLVIAGVLVVASESLGPFLYPLF